MFEKKRRRRKTERWRAGTKKDFFRVTVKVSLMMGSQFPSFFTSLSEGVGCVGSPWSTAHLSSLSSVISALTPTVTGLGGGP